MAVGITFKADTHEYWRDGELIPSVTQIIQAAGFNDYSFLPPEKRDAILRRGRFIDAGVNQIATGVFNPATLDRYPEVAGYFKAYMQFVENEGWSTELCQHVIYHESLGYAGTLDQVGGFKSKHGRHLVDVKHGDKPPNGTGIQLAGYANALTPEYVIANRYALSLHEDGTYNLTLYESNTDWVAFKACVLIYRKKQELKILGA